MLDVSLESQCWTLVATSEDDAKVQAEPSMRSSSISAALDLIAGEQIPRRIAGGLDADAACLAWMSAAAGRNAGV
jgi:hypothetical protein